MYLEESEPSEILPGLWIGGAIGASNPDFFKKNQIQSVLNCTYDLPNFFEEQGVKYHQLKVNDTLLQKDMVDMFRGLPTAIYWLYDHHDKKKLNVLVHCHQGIQRSVTAVVAYLYHTRIKNLEACINHVIKKRNIAYFQGTRCNFIGPLKNLCK